MYIGTKVNYILIGGGELMDGELEGLSGAELKVLAWKRGGSKEYLKLGKQYD